MEYSIYVALLLLVGLTGGYVAKRIGLPTVTGYILFGLILGPSVLNIITTDVYNALSFINEIALGILAITVGLELHRQMVKKLGKDLMIISVGNTLLSFIIVTTLTYYLGLELPYAMVLGALSMTVSPSGVVSMIKEKRAQGEFTQTLLGLVAFDNLITIIVFGVVTALAQASMNASGDSTAVMIAIIFRDILLGLGLGVLLGFFVSFFIRKKLKNDKLLVIILAAILLANGISVTFGLSAILVNIALGATITNLTNRKVLVSTVVNQIELPIFVIFLTMAGAHLDVSIVRAVGVIGLAYVGGRFVGKVAGATIFSHFTSVSKKVRKNIGLGLVPQAGVAIGLATIAEKSLTGSAGTITGVVLTGVVIFEIVGPLLVDRALTNVGETNVSE